MIGREVVGNEYVVKEEIGKIFIKKDSIIIHKLLSTKLHNSIFVNFFWFESKECSKSI